MRVAVGRVLWCVAGLLLIASCEVRRPKEVLAEEKMEAVLYDYHIAKVMAEEVPYSEAHRRPLYRKGVFEKHGITEEQFDSSMVWYTRNTELLAKMYERITSRLKQANEAVNHLIALRDMPTEEMPSGDSVEVWKLHRYELLTPVPMNSRIAFELTADSTFHERDSLCLMLDYRYVGLAPDTLEAAVVGLSLHFKNDSVIHAWQRLLAAERDTTELALQSDTLGELRTVSGFVYLPNGEKATSLRVHAARVMRYHAKDSLMLDKPDEKTPADSVAAAPEEKVQQEKELREQDEADAAAKEKPQRETDRLRQRRNNTAPPARKSPKLSRTLQPVKLNEN